MENHHTPPTFLTLPVEIRLRIYELVFEPRPSFFDRGYTNFLLVCRKMRSEGLRVCLALPRGFGSWAGLVQWISNANQHLLPLVKDILIDFCLEVPGFLEGQANRGDILGLVGEHVSTQSEGQSAQDLKATGGRFEPSGLYHAWLPRYLEFLQPSQNQDSLAPTETTECEEERVLTISSLWKSLSKLHGLQIVSVFFDHKDKTYTDKDAELAMEILAYACQHLRELTFDFAPISIDFLRNLHQLRLLCFSGYTRSSPEKTLEILSKLTCLDTVIIHHYPIVFYGLWHGINPLEISNYLSFTPRVLRGLRPLRRFEVRHIESSPPPTAIVPEMMNALLSHSATLRDLTICSSYRCDAVLLEKILEVIYTAKLTHLNLNVILPPKCNPKDIKSRIPTALYGPNIMLQETEIFPSHATQN